MLQIFDPAIGFLVTFAKGWLARTWRRKKLRFRRRCGAWDRTRSWAGCRLRCRLRRRPGGTARDREHDRNVFIVLTDLCESAEPGALRFGRCFSGVLFGFGIIPFAAPNRGGGRADFPRDEPFAA